MFQKENIFESTITTRYVETDQGGRIYHSHYFVWLDITRTEFLLSIGVDYNDLEKQGIYLVIKKAECDYIRPALYNKLLTIAINQVKCYQIKLEFSYSIFQEDVLIATAYTKLACVNRQGDVIKLPEYIVNRVNELNKNQ